MAVQMNSERYDTSIEELNVENLEGRISIEDMERLKKHKPTTLSAAVRAGVK